MDGPIGVHFQSLPARLVFLYHPHERLLGMVNQRLVLHKVLTRLTARGTHFLVAHHETVMHVKTGYQNFPIKITSV